MKVVLYDARTYDREFFDAANARWGHELRYVETRLTSNTVPLAEGSTAVCAFVNDELDDTNLRGLAARGVRLIALRSAGFNHVNLAAATELGLPVVRVPEYSPHAVAEHAVGLVLALNRKLHRAHARVRELNFSLEGLVGFDLFGKTVGIVGTGRIGRAAARIFRGFGCQILAHDIAPHAGFAAEPGIRYTDVEDLYRDSHVISLHVPLTPATRHLIDDQALGAMRAGVILINTGRGALIDSRALIDALKRGHVGAAGLDVYEEEEGIFFHDLSSQVLQDDVLARLLTFPNVLVTSHQAFLTAEALTQIATTTLASLTAFERDEPLLNEIRSEART